MAQYVDLSEIKAKLSRFVEIGGASGEENLFYVVCMDCDRIVFRTEHGEAYSDESFEVRLQHDCEDEFAEPDVLTTLPPVVEMEGDSESPEMPPHLGPVRNESPLPEPSALVMVGLMAQIQYVMDQETWRRQQEQTGSAEDDAA